MLAVRATLPCILVCLCLLFSLPARASALTEQEAKSAMTKALRLAGGYARISPRGVPLPALEILEPATLQARCGHPTEEVGACYLASSAKMLLSSEFQVNTPRGLSFLVHELTHHLQNMAVAPIAEMDCPAQTEVLAYRVQNQFNVAKGLATYTDAQIERFSNCAVRQSVTTARALD